MQKLDVAQQFVAPRPSSARADGAGARPSTAGAAVTASSWLSGLARWTDAQVAWALSAVLFVLAAYPIFLVEIPPYQDLPNHLAAVTVITHPAAYPEFVSNGFLKTNAALFTWLYFVGKVVGVKLAARLFALLVVAMNAIVFPQFVLRFGNRQKMLVASLFLGPMVHNWFVSMGMLDFALGVPLALVVLMLLKARLENPTTANALAICATTLLTWYAHCFALLMVHLLITVHVVSQAFAARENGVRAMWKAASRDLALLVVPQIPAVLLACWSVLMQLTEPVGEMTGYVRLGQLLPAWELLYNLWAEWFYGFTWLEISTFFTCVVLGVIALRARHQKVLFFSPLACVALLGFFVFLPYIATNWFHVNSRFIPFLWIAALVRVPDRLDKRLVGLLGLASTLYFVGMGVDYVRLDRDRAKFTAGISAVPEGSKLLPLIFSRKLTSQNTRSLLHAWGFYVMEKNTSAPLLFAHSQSFPVMYKEPPDPRFNHLVLEGFAPSMNSRAWVCDVLRSGGVVETDCDGAWRGLWREFWDDATPRYDHVLMWDPSDEVRAQVPPAYRATFHEDRLWIFQRVDAPETVATETTPSP